MASHMSSSSFLSASLCALCFFFFFFFFFCSLQGGEATESNHDLQHTHHLVHLSSLLPSSTCSSSTKGAKRESALEVLHKHGPCSQLKHEKGVATTHADILNEDQSRVAQIRAKLSNKIGHDKLDELDSTNLPAKSGRLIGSGNYYVTLGLGIPKRVLSLIFDTGSDLTWTQCKPCVRYCYKQQDPIFDPSKSTSYSNITCTSSTCAQLASATGNIPGCTSSSACIYGVQYGDSSYSVGYFAKERLTVTPTDVIDGFLFGCGQNNRGLFGGAAGLLGLGRNPISFVQQTAQKYRKIFSYCLPSTSSSVGYLAFGGAASKDVKYTPVATISRGASFYGLDVIAISVAGTKLPISASVFSAGGSIIDSGTVITRLPPTAYSALRGAFRRTMSQYPAAGELSLLDTCYDLSGYKSFYLPKISFVFGGGANVELAPSGILYVASASQACLAFAGNQDDSDVGIFGNVQQTTLQVVYDVGGGKIGFGAGGCE